MPTQNHRILRFNGGRISRFAVSREDFKRYPYSGEVVSNVIPRSLGNMMPRTGTQFVGETRGNNKAINIPFIFSATDMASIELTGGFMRVRVDEAVVSFPSTSTAVTNGSFATDLSGWTDIDEAGCTSQWYSGTMRMNSTGFEYAGRKQAVTVSGGDIGKLHALKFVVGLGEFIIKVGSTDGGDDYIAKTTIIEGTHILSFTPSGTFYITVQSSTRYSSQMESIDIYANADLEIATPWAEADLPNIRSRQSADVIFCACYNIHPMRIERRGVRSWSLVKYLTEDGMFGKPNISDITIAPSGLAGDIQLTASQALFNANMVGRLVEVTSAGQRVENTFTGSNQFSDPIRIGSVGDSNGQRSLGIIISGTWTATITLQRSYDEGASWVDVTTYTANRSSPNYSDGLDNQALWYRLGIKAGAYTSGAADVTLTLTSGSNTGVARITEYVSPTYVSAHALKPMGQAAATLEWRLGLWSSHTGFPSCLEFHDGRLLSSGNDAITASVSDAYSSFDDSIEGDSAPFSRTIGTGAVDKIAWMCSLQRLAVGGLLGEMFVSSSSLEEPLTASNFNIKTPSTMGSAMVDCVKLDNDVIFVQASGKSLIQLSYDGATGQYSSQELTALCPEIGKTGFVRLGIQRKPDTRIHAIRTDGTVAMMVYDKFQEVNALLDIDVGGIVEDVFTLPSAEEDKVYYVVRRTINGFEKRYIERFSMESECLPQNAFNFMMDCSLAYSGASTSTITGLYHLEGKEVIVWSSGYIGRFTVSAGQITLPNPVTYCTVGLPYSWAWKSSKLAIASAFQAGFNQKQQLSQVGLLLADTHHLGIRFGSDFDNMDGLPYVLPNGETATDETIHTDYDGDMQSISRHWTTGTQLCLEGDAPFPCNILGVTVTVKTSDKI